MDVDSKRQIQIQQMKNLRNIRVKYGAASKESASSKTADAEDTSSNRSDAISNASADFSRKVSEECLIDNQPGSKDGEHGDNSVDSASNRK